MKSDVKATESKVDGAVEAAAASRLAADSSPLPAKKGALLLPRLEATEDESCSNEEDAAADELAPAILLLACNTLISRAWRYSDKSGRCRAGSNQRE